MSNQRLLRIGATSQKSGKSRSGIYEGVLAGTFPAPVKIGVRSVAWLEAEVDAWIEARIAERDAQHSEPESKQATAFAR